VPLRVTERLTQPEAGNDGSSVRVPGLPLARPAAAACGRALPGAIPSHESLTLGIRASFKMATLVPCRVQAVGPVTVSLWCRLCHRDRDGATVPGQ